MFEECKLILTSFKFCRISNYSENVGQNILVDSLMLSSFKKKFQTQTKHVSDMSNLLKEMYIKFSDQIYWLTSRSIFFTISTKLPIPFLEHLYLYTSSFLRN